MPHIMRDCDSRFAITLAVLCIATGAQAGVIISSGATANMSCAGGVCTATAASAVLNVTHLRNLLASANLKVSTGGSLANDIMVTAGISWTSSHALTLYAYRNITIDQPISVAGSGGLDLESNRGSGAGYLTFGTTGNVTFFGLTNKLTIVGVAFTLVDRLATLASDISAHPTGHFALSRSYDAGHDGTYAASPIKKEFRGIFEGLGNAISNLSIDDPATPGGVVALFSDVGTGAIVRHFNLTNAVIKGAGNATVGGIASSNEGTLRFDSASGTISAGASGEVGGLVGFNEGPIEFSHASATVKASGNSAAGGLAGYNYANITSSYATGAVTGGNSAEVGGLVGNQQTGIITLCHATGAVTGGNDHSLTGGLIGFGGGSFLSDSYASGAVKGGFEVGGLVGDNTYGMSIRQSYATGTVTGTASNASVGGLVGFNEGPTSDSYATGAVSGDGNVGGLVGDNDDTIATSYATGAVTGSGNLGGLIGYDSVASSTLTDTYWDTTTSGITALSQGAGNVANDPGITGRTTHQLKSGLPAGFSSSIWSEGSGINGGLPYLLALPPA